MKTLANLIEYKDVILKFLNMQRLRILWFGLSIN